MLQQTESIEESLVDNLFSQAFQAYYEHFLNGKSKESFSVPPQLCTIDTHNQVSHIYSSVLESERSINQSFHHDYAVRVLLFAFNTILGNSNRLSIISKNETIDDIPTNSMKYIFLNFIIGHLHSELSLPVQRLESLQLCDACLHKFMTDCLRLKVIDSLDEAIYLKHYNNSDVEFESKCRTNSALDRTELIARDRRMRAKQTDVTEIMDGSSWWEFSLMAAQDTTRFNDSEEFMRDLYLKFVSFFCTKSLKILDFLLREAEILMMQRNAPKIHTPDRPSTLPHDRTTGNKPWSISINSREELERFYRGRVFQPAHTLPTITLAECGEIEMAMDLSIGGNTNNNAAAKNDESAHSSDEDEIAQRMWDNWKDDNPKGSGNTMHNVG